MKTDPFSPRASLRRRLLAEIRHAAPGVPLVAGACLSVSAYAQTAITSNQSSTYNLGGTTTALTVNAGVSVATSSGAGISGGSSSVSGVTITNNGTVSESDSTGVVTTSGIYLSKSGTVVNNGTISGSGWSGVYLKNGGEVDNFGVISGTHDGIELNSTSGTIVNGSASNTSAAITASAGPAIYNSLSGVTGVNLTNYGTLSSGGSGFAVALAGSGTITNYGTISGSRGVYLSSGTLVNYGTITASSGIYGVAFGSASTLELETGSSITGSIYGGGGSLKLDGTGAMSNSASAFSNLTMQGANWTLAGNVTATHTEVASGVLNVTGTLASSGGVTVDSGATIAGTGTVTGSVSATTGSIVQAGSSSTPGTLSVSGNYTQQPGATLEIATTTTSASRLSVTGSAALGGTLLVDSATGDYSGNPSFIIMTALGGLTGTFGAVLDSNSNVVPTLTYDSANNRIVLSLANAALWSVGNNDVTLTGNVTTAQDGGGGTDTLNLVGSTTVTADLTNIQTLNVGTSSATASAVAMNSGAQQFQATTIYPNATLTLNTATFVPGTLTLAGGMLDAKADLTDAAPVVVSANSQISADAGHTVTLSGNATGAGALQKSGDGMLVLNGQNTYSGGTSVSAGTLEVGDINHASATVTGNVDVAAAGTLRGHGTVTGDVSNLGTVRPGGSIGTLTVNGNYTQSSSATLMVDVTPTGASMLNVGGTATLGGTLALVYGPGTYSASTFRILKAAAINGTFSSITGNTPAGFTQSVAISNAAVDLSLSGASVVVAPTNATIFGTLGASAIRDGQRANTLLLDRLASQCMESACGAGGFAPHYHGWIQASADSTRVHGNNGAPSYNDHRYGFLAGVDKMRGAWTTGIAGGYSHSDLSEDQTGSTGSVDTVRLATYGGRRAGIVNLAADVGVAYDFLSSKREFGALGKTEGDSHGQEVTAGMQASVPMHLAGLLVTPAIGARYAYFHGNAFGESGVAGEALSIGTQNYRSLQPYAAVSADYAFRTIHGQRATIGARLGYAYETLGAGREVSVAASDGTGFDVPGVTSSRGMLTAGLGVSLPVTKALKLTADWNTLFRTGNTSAQTVKVGVDYRF